MCRLIMDRADDPAGLVKMRDVDGNSALLHAVYKGHGSVSEFLVPFYRREDLEKEEDCQGVNAGHAAAM